MHEKEDIAGLPLARSLKVLKSEALQKGRIEFTDLGFDIPGFDKGAYVPPSQEANGIAFMLYACQFLNDAWVRKDLIKAAKLYPFKNYHIDLLDLHQNEWELYENRREKPTKEYRDYREAIMHVCARGRMGSTWPLVLHGSIVTYLAWRPDVLGDSKERTFLPILTNRVINPAEGALDGYYEIPHAKIQTTDGEKVALIPDQTKREALKGHNRETRKLIEANFEEMKQEMQKALGYERRRPPTLTSIETWGNWLFRRHLLRESSEEIAADYLSTADFVGERVKFFRKAIDLQPKKSVRCIHGRPPLYY